jgi:hypothetical protein
MIAKWAIISIFLFLVCIILYACDLTQQPNDNDFDKLLQKATLATLDNKG